ncbi:MAG: hypothetical protein H8E32_09280 [Nitrospinae bacterium]|nr:hypothetical protein [Nitrospinota bacterium]
MKILRSTAIIPYFSSLRGLLVSGWILFQIFFFISSTWAQIEPFQFDQISKEETLRDQQILREQMQLQQEILREEMERVRVETQKIMKDISLAMKEEAVKLKEELQELQKETTKINKEIVDSLEQAKKDFSEGRDEMRKELENMRKEAKSLTKEISVVLEEQGHVWKEETVSLQDSLMEAKAELAAAQADSDEILESSRSAYRDFQTDKVVTMNDSKEKSGEAMDEAGNTLQKSTRDYKKASERTSAEILAQMKDAKNSLRRQQANQRKNAANTNRQILASVQKDKLSRNAELQNSKSQNRADLKKARQLGQAAQADSRLASLRRADSQAASKNKGGRSTDSVQDDETGGFGDGVLGAQGNLESFEDDSAANRRRGSAADGEEEGREGPPTLAELKERLLQFGNRIKILKKQIEENRGNPSPELIELGNEYLAAQRFIDSRDDFEKLALLQFANEEALPLGSYEQAAWAFKIALGFNTNKGETHLAIGKIYDEIQDGNNAIMYAKLAHLVFRQKKNSEKLKETQSFIDSLTKKYEDKAS